MSIQITPTPGLLATLQPTAAQRAQWLPAPPAGAFRLDTGAVMTYPFRAECEITAAIKSRAPFTKRRNITLRQGATVLHVDPGRNSQGDYYRFYTNACVGYLIGAERTGQNRCRCCRNNKGHFARCVYVPNLPAWDNACMNCFFRNKRKECSQSTTQVNRRAARAAAIVAQVAAAQAIAAQAGSTQAHAFGSDGAGDLEEYDDDEEEEEEPDYDEEDFENDDPEAFV